jgi:zinc and cadmium transporter
MLTYILLSALFIMLVSLVGKLSTWKGFGKFIQPNTQYLITFASGIFTIIIFSLFKETLELSHSLLITTASILIGMLVIHTIIGLLPTAHHHHSIPAGCGHKHSHIDARRMMWSDFFHNAGDGVLLVSAYAVNIHVGITATIGILLHEIVQEISEFFVLKEAGYSTNKALFYNFLVSSSILIGIFLAFFISSTNWLMIPLMGLATGGFIYALSRDLIPHTIHHAEKTNTPLKHVIIFIFGIILMLFINNLAPHSHESHSLENNSTTPKNISS